MASFHQHYVAFTLQAYHHLEHRFMLWSILSWPLCPPCNTHIHNTHHLFNCTHIRTPLSLLYLWTDPAGVTALLDRWTDKFGVGPQAGRLPPPLARDDIYIRKAINLTIWNRLAFRLFCMLQICGSELDLPALHEIMKYHGGMENVMEKNKWPKVMEALKLPKVVSHSL